MSDASGPLCTGCQFHNPIGAPFCVRCSQALFSKKKKKQEAAPTPSEPTPVDANWSFPGPAIPCHPRLKTRLSHRDEDLAIALLPLASEASGDQTAALARALGMEIYEARLRLSSCLPRLIKLGEPALLAPFAEILAGSGIPFVFIPARALLTPLDPRFVEGVHRDQRGLILSCPTELGEVETLLLEPNRSRLLVSAVEEETRGGEPGLEPKRATGGLFRKGRTERKKTRVERRYCFHLYIAASPRPVLFREDRIADYHFLGEAMGPTARENFLSLFEDLKTGVAACDVSPKENAGVLDQVLADISREADRYLEAVIEPAPIQDPRSGRARCSALDVLSRLIFYRWWMSDQAQRDR